MHFNINIKLDKTKVKQCRRDFRKGNYKDIRKSLALIDCNDKIKYKTVTEYWNILRGAVDSAIALKHDDVRYQNKPSARCIVG